MEGGESEEQERASDRPSRIFRQVGSGPRKPGSQVDALTQDDLGRLHQLPASQPFILQLRWVSSHLRGLPLLLKISPQCPQPWSSKSFIILA